MEYRAAQKQDIPGMARIRAESWETESYWIPRIEAYLAGRHSPQKALAPRAAFVAVEADQVAGVVSGHLTTRFDCEGLDQPTLAAKLEAASFADLVSVVESLGF